MRTLSYDNPFFERFQTRLRRRLIAVGFVAVAIVLPIATGIAESWLIYGAMLALLTAFGLLLAGSIRGIGDYDRQLDERGSQLRSNAYRYMYWTAVIIAAWGGMTVSDYMDAEKWMMALGIVTFSSAIIYTLPSILLAWQLPSEGRDED